MIDFIIVRLAVYFSKSSKGRWWGVFVIIVRDVVIRDAEIILLMDYLNYANCRIPCICEWTTCHRTIFCEKFAILISGIHNFVIVLKYNQNNMSHQYNYNCCKRLPLLLGLANGYPFRLPMLQFRCCHLQEIFCLIRACVCSTVSWVNPLGEQCPFCRPWWWLKQAWCCRCWCKGYANGKQSRSILRKKSSNFQTYQWRVLAILMLCGK